MGLIARILDSFKGDDGEPSAKVEVYKGDNITARIFNPPGVDARPLDQDICFTEDSEDTEGGKDILGFIDQKNEPVAEKGENRTYARDADGVVVGFIYLKKDGTLQIEIDGKANFITKDDFIVTVDSGKKVAFGNGTDEVLDLFDQELDELIKLVGNTMLGGSVDSPGVASTGTNSVILSLLVSMKTAFESIKTALGNIKV